MANAEIFDYDSDNGRFHLAESPGLGATISRATDKGDFALLACATLAMAAIVLTTNRLAWRRLLHLPNRRQ